MKKIDALLKKVEFFERLAIYGDRKSFLKSLAQQNEYSKAYWKSRLDHIIDSMRNPEPENQALLQKTNIGTIIEQLNWWSTQPEQTNPGRDLNQLYVILNNVLRNTKQYSELYNYVFSVMDQAKKLEDKLQVQDSTKINRSLDGEESSTENQPEPAKPSRPAYMFPTAVQEKLQELGFRGASGEDVKGDGKLGPITRNALSEYKKANPDAANLSGDALYNHILENSNALPTPKTNSFPTSVPFDSAIQGKPEPFR